MRLEITAVFAWDSECSKGRTQRENGLTIRAKKIMLIIPLVSQVEHPRRQGRHSQEGHTWLKKHHLLSTAIAITPGDFRHFQGYCVVLIQTRNCLTNTPWADIEI